MKQFSHREIKIFDGTSPMRSDPKPEKVLKPKYNLKTETAKKKTKSFVGTQIKILDALFSVYVRSSGADKNGYVKCVTCPKKLPWKQMDCGHCYSRKSYAIRWDLKNCGPQCKECNQVNDGEHEKFKEYINKKYGPETTGMLWTITQMPYKLNREFLEKKIAEYKLLTQKK